MKRCNRWIAGVQAVVCALLLLWSASAEEAPLTREATVTNGVRENEFRYPAEAELVTEDLDVCRVLPAECADDRANVMIEILAEGKTAAAQLRENDPENTPILLADGMVLYVHQDAILGVGIDRPDGAAFIVQAMGRADTGVNDILCVVVGSLTDSQPLADWLAGDDQPIETLYYNPAGGIYYHYDPNCPSVSEKYLPLTAFDAALLDSDPAFSELRMCMICTK